MMEPITLSYDILDPDVEETYTLDPQFERKIADIFRQYLSSDDGLSQFSAAHSIIALLPDPSQSDGEWLELSILWEICLATAEQIPYYHDGQLKLARLLMVLRNSPMTSLTGRVVSKMLSLLVTAKSLTH